MAEYNKYDIIANVEKRKFIFGGCYRCLNGRFVKGIKKDKFQPKFNVQGIQHQNINFLEIVPLELPYKAFETSNASSTPDPSQPPINNFLRNL